MQVTFIHLASIDYRPNNNSNNLIITAKTDKLFLQLGWFMNLMLNKINLKIKLKHHLSIFHVIQIVDQKSINFPIDDSLLCLQYITKNGSNGCLNSSQRSLTIEIHNVF